jgi:hypothetical protein
MMGGPYAGLFQAAWIVDDLTQAVDQWLATTNVGPFYLIPHAQVDGLKYRGEISSIDMSAALAQAGPLQIELIEQHSGGPSAYRDAFPKGSGGFHHLARMTQTFDADMERYRRQGLIIAAEGAFGDMRFAYIDTRSELGHMTEVIEDRDSIKSIFNVIAAASVGWDRSDPVRHL